MAHNIKFKQGAASFYIVAIATLILVIMATSFAAIIMSEIARTSNDDLAQSAYDSALAGVEDAKLAYSQYKKCVADGESGCSSILNNLTADDCGAIAKYLGRIPNDSSSSEVKIKESTSGDNSMDQAYTCVKILPLGTFTATFPASTDKSTQVIKVSTEEGRSASEAKSILVQWGYTDDTIEDTPPMLEVGLIQTADNFTLDDFTMTRGDKTNRGTLFLVPKESGNDTIDKNGFLKSNNKVANNSPYQVACDGHGPTACSVNIELPNPVSDTDAPRSDSTFHIVLSLYGATSGAKATFALCSGTGTNGCGEQTGNPTDPTDPPSGEIVPMNLQIAVDSTGRANDLYRRVYTILQPAELNGKGSSSTPGSSSDDPGSASLYYALSAQNIKKIEYSTCETVFSSDRAGCED